MIKHDKPIEMVVLNQISHVLVHQHDVSSLLNEVLDILYCEMGLNRGTVTLLRDNTLFIEASHGLSRAEELRGKYELGEGITGKVAAIGKAIIIPEIADEPAFLDRTGSRTRERGVAFICVPIIYQEKVIGTMSIDRVKNPETDLERDKNLLETVANILADAVAAIIRSYDEKQRLLEENRRLKQELNREQRPQNIVGNCSAMRMVYSMIEQVADSQATVLIRGASGTGKELVARAIHQASPRVNNPFVAVNCAALPENLIESELFGHEKGSFTGATTRRTGRAEAANGGTLFLDEIGDLSPQVQVKLLRFLQEKSFERVGSNKTLTVDVRILAATSRNLEQLMQEGAFREDLYYRLNVFPIHMPSLHERRADIMLLADHFLARYSKVYNKDVKRISTSAINMMMAYHWPGNVRELENCIERAVLTSTDNVIHGYNLPPSLQTGQATNTSTIVHNNNVDLATMVASFEREVIIDALKMTRGNVASAARKLGSTPRIIHYKITKLNINPNTYK